jgi:hypothetical protein
LLIFIILNPVHSIFHGVRKRHIEEESLVKLKPVLSNLLKDNDVYQQTQEESFGEEFAQFCRSVKEGKPWRF